MAPVPRIPDGNAVLVLTRRERMVLKMMAQGLIDKEICTRTKRKRSTVRTHIQNIFRKLGVDRRAVLVRVAVRAGLVEV